jgi:hypothetical protein
LGSCAIRARDVQSGASDFLNADRTETLYDEASDPISAGIGIREFNVEQAPTQARRLHGRTTGAQENSTETKELIPVKRTPDMEKSGVLWYIPLLTRIIHEGL